jgi:hypothetical protein
MTLDAELQDAIVRHPSPNVAQVAKDVSEQLNRHVPITTVVKVRGSLERSANVNRAREAASGTLGEKIGRIEKASEALEGVFFDPTLPLKDRIEASKELRQWTKLGLDAAGIHDAESETVFLVESAWDPVPTKGSE